MDQTKNIKMENEERSKKEGQERKNVEIEKYFKRLIQVKEKREIQDFGMENDILFSYSTSIIIFDYENKGREYNHL